LHKVEPFWTCSSPSTSPGGARAVATPLRRAGVNALCCHEGHSYPIVGSGRGEHPSRTVATAFGGCIPHTLTHGKCISQIHTPARRCDCAHSRRWACAFPCILVRPKVFFTADDEYLDQLDRFAEAQGMEKVSLLPAHTCARHLMTNPTLCTLQNLCERTCLPGLRRASDVCQWATRSALRAGTNDFQSVLEMRCDAFDPVAPTASR